MKAVAIVTVLVLANIGAATVAHWACVVGETVRRRILEGVDR